MLRTSNKLIRSSTARLNFVRCLSDSVTSNVKSSSSMESFEYVQTRDDDGIGFIEIHRPRELNALNEQTLNELNEAAQTYDNDPSISVLILHGNDRVFATGMDLSTIISKSYNSIRYKNQDPFKSLDKLSTIKKPLIAAVNGFALGTGCELALTSDIIIAGEDATFGQPEIQLGMLPASGGTQRLLRAIGKAKTMEMILTGRQMNVEEAERSGLISRVTKKGNAIQEATEVAKIITRYSLPVLINAKESVNAGFESNLSSGLLFEKRAFQSNFVLDDCKEGLKAFVDGRKPHFTNR